MRRSIVVPLLDSGHHPLVTACRSIDERKEENFYAEMHRKEKSARLGYRSRRLVSTSGSLIIYYISRWSLWTFMPKFSWARTHAFPFAITLLFPVHCHKWERHSNCSFLPQKCSLATVVSHRIACISGGLLYILMQKFEIECFGCRSADTICLCGHSWKCADARMHA